ncbi:MAG: hypothetical protein H0T69_17085 [Thermoleophilaceae bacterium]|nr:hypothetical protein [Thermoleophilaceae bacterium]
MRRARSRRLARRGATCFAAVALLALAVPASAFALPSLPDLTPDIPGPADLVKAMFEFLLDTFFGIEANVTQRVVEFLVAHPIYSDQARYPELNQLRAYVSAGGWALLTLTITIASLRYWASGFTASGSYEAIQGMVRGATAAGAMIAYPLVFEWLCVTGNLVTHALLQAPGVHEGITKLLAAALVSNFSPLGIGVIASVVAVVMLVLLMVTKIVLATVLALLFVSGGLAIALWPLPETAWVARTWLQVLLAVLLWPVVWALCFALFAVLGRSAFSFKGEFGDELVKPFVTVAALWVAFKAPQLIARQAMLAGLAPSLGGGLARTMVYGRQLASSASGSAGRGAEGVSGRFATRSSGAADGAAARSAGA